MHLMTLVRDAQSGIFSAAGEDELVGQAHGRHLIRGQQLQLL